MLFQKGIVSTANPQNLPKQPVPPLRDTMDKYLTTVRPLLSDDEYSNTKRLVNEFLHSDTSSLLQNYLEQRATSTLNWFEEWKLITSYLGRRSPVLIYTSPGQSLPFHKFKCDDDRLSYTAKLISAAISFKILIDEKKVPVDKRGRDEMDMKQYSLIFGTIRIPCSPIDGIQTYPKSEHIVVAHKNHFFKLQVFVDCKPLSERQIYDQLDYIVSQSREKVCPVGILSADHRDTWAKTYTDLLGLNASSVAEIQQSLFMVCLDDPIPCSNNHNLQTEGFLQFIHGGGSNENTGNRWFDKTIQFIVGTTGFVGLTFEHALCEAVPFATMVDYVVDFMKKDGAAAIPDNTGVRMPEKLTFELNDKIISNVKESEKNVDKVINNFQLSCFKFNKYGKEFIKSQKLSPDSYIQIAMELAYYRMYKKPAAHHEPTSTRIYVGGRTEAVRSCSVESVRFAQCMLEDGVSDECKISYLRHAVNSHKKYAVEAGKGYGVDRHLLGLQLAAKELCCETPEMFNDVGYTRSTRFKLSGSQVAAKCDVLLVYGPWVNDGYGLGYNPRNDDINFGLSAWKNCTTNIQRFKDCLIQSLCEMQELLSKNDKSEV